MCFAYVVCELYHSTALTVTRHSGKMENHPQSNNSSRYITRVLTDTTDRK